MEYTWTNQPQPPFKFKDGQRVVLKAVPVGDVEYPEGLTEECGVVLGDGEVTGNDQVGYGVVYYRVEVDGCYTLSDCSDDGLREVSEDQMEDEYVHDVFSALTIPDPEDVGKVKGGIPELKRKGFRVSEAVEWNNCFVECGCKYDEDVAIARMKYIEDLVAARQKQTPSLTGDSEVI